MNIVKVKVHEYEAECVRVYLHREQLTLLYAHAVGAPHTVYVGVIFQMDSILVDVDYIVEINEMFEHLSIMPDYTLSPSYYELLTESFKNANK